MPYTIKTGDNLTKIASQFGTNIQDILKLNPTIKDPNLIYAGSNLILPSDQKVVAPVASATPVLPAPTGPIAPAPVAPPVAPVAPVAPAVTTPVTPVAPAGPTAPTAPVSGGSSYIIQPGDNLSTLAAKYGTSVGALMASNPQIKDPNKIYAGQSLSIPGAGGTPAAKTETPVPGTDTGAGKTAKVDVIPTPDTNHDGVVNEVDIATNTRDEIYKKYGIDTAVHNWETNPTKSYEDVYKDVFNTLNLGDVQTKINGVIAQIDQANKDFQTATEGINENPWISEAGRTGKIAKLQQSYDMTINRLQGTQTLLENAINRGKDEAKSTADRAITTFNQNRTFQKEELDLLIARAEADIAASDKGRTAQKALDKKTYTNIKEIDGGLYDLETNKWIVPRKTPDGNTSTVNNPSPKDNTRVSTVQALINGKKGGDGKIAWETYAEAAQKWIGLGGSVTDFKVAFPPELYMNAGNIAALPSSLKPSGSSGSGSSSDFYNSL